MLSSDRQFGMGIGPIPFSSIDRLARRYPAFVDDFDRLLDIMTAMDLAFRQFHSRKSDG